MRNHLLTLLQTVGVWHVSSCCFRIFLHPHVFTVWLQFILMWISLIFILVSICWTLWIRVFHQFGKFSVIISSNLFLLFSRSSLLYRESVICVLSLGVPQSFGLCLLFCFLFCSSGCLLSRVFVFKNAHFFPHLPKCAVELPFMIFFFISIIGLFQLENFCLLPIYNCSLFIAIFILFLYHFPDLH